MKFKKIKDICEIKKGKKILEIEQPVSDSVRYIQIDDLRNNNNIKYCSLDSSYVYVNKEDLIIAWDGANAGTIGFNLEGAIGSTLAKISVLDKGMFAPFLALYLQSKFDYFQRTATGATIPHISRVALENLEVPVFSIEKQKYTYKQMLKMQELIEKRQSQITALDELIQSLFLEMFGDPVTNSMGWELQTLKEFGEWKSGGTPSRSNKEYYTGNIPWLSSGELNDIYTSQSSEHITENAVEESSAKYIEEGSILLGMYDTAALKSTIAKMKCTCNQAIAFSKLNEDKVSTLYVYQYIQMAKEHLKRQQRGVRQKNMNLSMIKDLIVMYPPVELQKQFEEKLKAILEKKQLFIHGLIELETLYNSLLQKSFKGELF